MGPAGNVTGHTPVCGVAAHQADPSRTTRLGVVGPGVLEDPLRTTALDRMFTVVSSVSEAAT